MASSGFIDSNSLLNDKFEKSHSKIHSNEHEDTIKTDQMATKKLSNSIDEKPLEDLDEHQLKHLLDEAMDYKSPKDANDKSDTFKLLLKNVTEEDMKVNERYGLKQSNSLQNLFDDSHYQLSSHQSHTSSKKHHNQRRKNSTSVSARRLEGGSLPIDMHHSSAVQSPPDQPFLSEYKKKRKEKQQKDTMIDIEIDEKKLMSRHFDTNKDGISSSYPHDGIELKSMSYTNSVDLEIQDSKFPSAHTIPTSITTISSMAAAGGPPLATASIINPKVTSSAAATSSAMHSVDKIIEFPSLIEKAKSYQPQHQLIDVTPGSTINHNNNIVLANHGLNFGGSSGGSKLGGIDVGNLPLNSTYTAVTSLTSNDKGSTKNYKQSNYDNAPIQNYIQTAPMIAAAHQAPVVANSKEAKSKAKRAAKSERNEKTIDVKMIQGFRGTDELEDLLKYIEDGDGKQQKSHPKNGIVASNQTNDHLLSAEEKKKKMAAKNKEKVNKLKKSNSMDELCSTGRQEQEQQEKSSTAANKIIQDVTLRSKSSNLTSGAKKGDKNEKSQQKRNERRSWGTEGLWTEATSTVDPPRDSQDENQEIESSSSSSSSGIPSEIISDSTTGTINAEPAAAVASETEFHVVTKKRKVKRKSNDAGDMSKATSSLHNYNIRRDSNIRSGARNYNDRDVGSKNPRNSKPSNQDPKASTGKNRRKSTSSMPPSDDDCYSDGGDSVQSLPIETTKTTSSQLLSATAVAGEASLSTGSGKGKKNSNHSQQQHQHQKPATFSYADIAKTNANRNSGTNVTTSTEKWPSISASSSNATHQTTNDPFSIANFDAVNSSLNNHKSQQQLQQQQHKPAPITTSMMSFPELVETNNNKNKQLSSNPSSSSSEIASNGETINTTEKPLNGLDAPRAFDSNNNNSNVATDDRVNNNQKISYSQSLLESHHSHQELDSNGNNVKTDISALSTVNTPNGTIAKAVLTKSKSVDHNNLSSIEHYPALEKTQATLGEVFSKQTVTLETYASKSKQRQVKLDVKPVKKEKLKKSSSVQSPQFPQQNAILDCRPAVIILNDCAKPSDADCGITFGFDINEHLLFGHQNGDDMGGDACSTEVSLETNNNNNNCDITNTNLSSNNNNLPNHPSELEIYENFIASQSIVIGDEHIMTLSSQSSPQQQHSVLDSSNQSSSDMGYSSSSLITHSTSPATQKSTSAMISDEQVVYPTLNESESQRNFLKRIARLEDCKFIMPQFVLPEPVKFNQDELVTFVSDEWTKVLRTSVYFNGQ